MKIGLCSLYSPFSGYGGLETQTFGLGENLYKQGHEAFYIAFRKFGLSDGCYYLPYPEKGSFVFERQFIYDTVIDPILLRNFINRKKLDVLHMQFMRGSVSAFLTKQLHDVPIIIGAHTLPRSQEPERNGYESSGFGLKMVDIVYEFILRNADTVICPSKFLANILMENYHRTCYVIPNSIYVEEYKRLPQKDFAKKALGINIPTILFMGRLTEERGVTHLISAMPRILAEVKCQLLIAGDVGPINFLKSLVKKLRIEEYVTFLGRVSGQRKFDCFAAADIFACPSLKETFGIANLEAMASGLPIVATKVGAIPEMIEGKVNGYLVPPRNSEALSEALIGLLLDNKLRKRMGLVNREKSGKYDWSRTINSFIHIYEKLLT